MEILAELREIYAKTRCKMIKREVAVNSWNIKSVYSVKVNGGRKKRSYLIAAGDIRYINGNLVRKEA